jgi:hypothetical protein
MIRIITYVSTILLMSCTTQTKEYDDLYIIPLDSNSRVGMYKYGKTVELVYPDMKNCFNEKFITSYKNLLHYVLNNKKWNFDLIWIEYAKSDTLYSDNFKHLISMLTSESIKEDTIIVEENNRVIYLARHKK